MRKNIKNDQKLSVRDLIITGVFSALIFTSGILGGFFFAINPLLTFYMPLGVALLPGPIYLLMIAKVKKPGAISIVGILLGMYFYLTGMHWGLYVGYFVMSIIADFFAGIKNYSNIRWNIISYVLFCLSATGTYIVYFLFPSQWIAFMAKKGTDIAYIRAMQEATHWWILIIILAGTICIASLSGLLGARLLERQFKRAGITR